MMDLFQLISSPDVIWWTGVVWIIVMFLSDSHSDGTHSLQSIHWLSFWRHPFTAEHPLTLILTAPIHCRASIDSHSDGTHSLQSIHWLSFWRHPFTAEHPLMNKWCDATFLQIWWRNKLILNFIGQPDNLFFFFGWTFPLNIVFFIIFWVLSKFLSEIRRMNKDHC